VQLALARGLIADEDVLEGRLVVSTSMAVQLVGAASLAHDGKIGHLDGKALRVLIEVGSFLAPLT